MSHKHSDYMHWAKTESRAPYNLATSGVGPFPLRELPVDLAQLEINGDNSYGYAPLVEAIAQKSGVDPDCVVTSAGASGSNHLALAALLERGDEILIEYPAYELLLATALNLGADVKRFARREEDDYALDPREVRRGVTKKTKLIVITNLHNPTSTLTPETTLREIGDIAASVGARVLVDEVYLDAVYDNTPRTAFHLGPEFIITNSLTKLYGLSGIRCGWVLAQPDLANAMRRLNDLFGVIPVFAGEAMAVAAFQNLDRIRARARAVVEADRALLNHFLATHDQISAPRRPFGTTSFMRLCNGDTDEFISRLRGEYDTSVVPGSFFGMPQHFRVGMGVNTEMFGEGLRRIGLALEYRSLERAAPMLRS